MPFGSCNAPATFQRLMNTTLADFIGKFIMVYLDDIIIFSATIEKHYIDVNSTLLRLDASNLRLNPSKCKFFQESIKFLGHLISKDGTHPDPSKVEAIQNLTCRRDRTQVQSFLGLANYYRRFIKDFAKIAKPLHDLIKKHPVRLRRT